MNSRLVRWRSILAGEKKLARPRVAFPISVSHSEPQYLEKSSQDIIEVFSDYRIKCNLEVI